MKKFIRIFLSLIIVLLCVMKVGSNTKINYSEPEKEKLLKGEVIVREVPAKQKTGRRFEALGLIRASIKEIYQVLTNFEEYPKFMPNVSKVETLYSDTNRAVINYTLGLPLRRIKRYRLDMTYEDNEVKAKIKWKMINWPGIKESETIQYTEGYWLLENFPEGSYTIVLYHVYTDPGHIPLGLGWIVDILTKKSVPATIIKTRERVNELKNGGFMS